ncbi:MAG: DNA polymerase III subunit delta [Bacteroidota bacterium]
MPNILFLYGNDEFAIARRLRDLESGFPDPTSADMNIARLDARTASANDLNTAVNAMPFLASHRLVILSNPSAKYVKPPERRKFEEFLSAAPESTRLVLCEAIEPKEAEKHWLVKWAAKNGARMQGFMLPRLRDMAGWIVNEARTQGGAIQPQAAARLVEMVGTDTRQAGMEIGKLLAYAGWSRPVTIEDVEAVSILTAEPDVFQLVDALAEGRIPAAQEGLHRLLQAGDAFALWGMIIRQFRYLLIAREVIDAHGMVPDVQEALSQVEHRPVHEFVAEKTFRQARGFSMPSLEAVYRRLLLMDEAAKTGQMPLDLALDVFVGEMAK